MHNEIRKKELDEITLCLRGGSAEKDDSVCDFVGYQRINRTRTVLLYVRDNLPFYSRHGDLGGDC